MAGFFGGCNLSSYNFSGQVHEQVLRHYENYTYGTSTLNKFEQERFIIDNDTYICVFEGFLFDIGTFSNQKELFESELSYSNVEEFLKNLDGTFSISIFFKEPKQLFLVTDHLAAYKIFYAQSGDKLIFSTDLFDITKYFNSINEANELDLDSVYYFLGFGSVVKDKTLFKNIKKLDAGTYLKFDIDSNKVEVSSYHELNFNNKCLLSEDEIVDRYQELISKPMKRIISLNKKYNLENIAGLSGGLDSKSMVVMMNEMARKKLTTFTFAESGSLDQTIAQTVSTTLGTMHVFFPLDKGNCLKYSFDEVVKNSNGLVAIHTLLHNYNSFGNLDAEKFGLLLTGQIGDAIFGSHFIGNKTVKEYITSKSHYGRVPDFICEKIGYMDEVIASYSHNNSEAYIYEGRISNGTMYGDIVNRNKIDTITPFYSKKLLDFTLTVPEKYRVDEYIYFKWLKKHHPTMLSFKWDKCDCKPSSQFKVKLFKKIYTIKNALKKRLKIKYDGMNPFDVWYRESPEILKDLDEQFLSHIDILDFNPELKSDVNKLYYADVDRYKRNKFTILTLLLSLKIHNG